MKSKEVEENLYTEILVWAYHKRESGFTWAELGEQFKLNNVQDAWIKKVFLTSDDRDRKFIEILRNDETAIPNVHYYSLNEKGMSFAVNYLGLKEAQENSNKANSLSRFAVWVGIISILLGSFSIYLQNKSNNLTRQSLEISTDPPISINAQYPVLNPDLVYATSSVAEVSLRNDFFGDINNINIFVDYLIVAQDKKNFSQIWVCDKTGNTNAVASSSLLGKNKSFNFSFPFPDYYIAGGYIDSLKDYIYYEPIIRVRVKFEKEADHVLKTKDYYYRAVFDKFTLIKYENYDMPSAIRTEYGAINKNKIIPLLQDAEFNNLDKRCFINPLKTPKGINY